MRIVHVLSDTPIGRALIAFFVDLPRWALMNLLFAVSLAGVLLGWLRNETQWVRLMPLPAVLVGAQMINMAARQAGGGAPRWRDVFAWPVTYLVGFALWAMTLLTLTLLLADPPPVIFFTACALLLGLLMIGVFALCMPALLNVTGLLIWRNALLLTAVNPVVALGLLALLAVAGWAVWVSRGALILAVPALWTLIAVFSIHDRIVAFQSASSGNTNNTN